MIRRFLPVGFAVAAVLAAIPATAVQATAPAAAPAGRLTVTVIAPDGTRTARTLRCGPVGGDHPTPAKACAALTKAGGDPNRLPARTGVCTMQYAPITAIASGRWVGRPVQYRQTFGNDCQLSLRTRPVFTF